jgi:hypothetical protein
LLLLTHHETGLWGHSTLYLNSEFLEKRCISHRHSTREVDTCGPTWVLLFGHLRFWPSFQVNENYNLERHNGAILQRLELLFILKWNFSVSGYIQLHVCSEPAGFSLNSWYFLLGRYGRRDGKSWAHGSKEIVQQTNHGSYA